MPIDQFKTQVLLLHSEQSTLDTLSSSFGDHFTVHCATSGSEALNTMIDTPINVIISAQDLPGMSGLEALREAKKRSPETIGILLASSSDEALVGDEEVFQVVHGDVTGDKLSQMVDNATQQMRLMALAESANDTAAAPDEPSAEHIVMETSDHGASIISDGTGRNPVLRAASMPGQSQAARAIDVLVLTKDQAFLETIKDSARGMHVVHYANTLAQADDAIRKHKVGVAVVDAAMVGSKLEQLTKHLRKGSSRLVAVVAGRRDDGDMLLDLINRGKVYRFLMKPVSPGRARLAIEASVNHHLDAPDSAFDTVTVPALPATTAAAKAPTAKVRPRTTAAAAPATKATDAVAGNAAIPSQAPEQRDEPILPFDDGLGAFDEDESSFTATVTGLVSNLVGKNKDSDATDANVFIADGGPPSLSDDLDGPSTSGGSGIPLKLIGVGIAAIAIIGGGLYWTQKEPSPVDLAEPIADEAQPAATTEDAVAEQPAPVESPALADADLLLNDAREARSVGQIYNPVGGSAIELYAMALTAAPDSEVIAAELDETIMTALGMAEAAMLENRLSDAEAALARVAEVDPDNARLPFLTTQLTQTQLRGRLDAARIAIRENRFEDAASAIAAARALNVSDMTEVDAVDIELDDALSAQQLDEVLDAANARLDSGALLEPANDNARHYFQLVLSADPENIAARQGLNVIAGKLVLQARTEIDAGNLDAAADLLDEANAIDASNADLATAVDALNAARAAIVERERQAALERERQEELARQQAEAERLAAEQAAAEQAAAEQLAAEQEAAPDTESPAAAGTELAAGGKPVASNAAKSGAAESTLRETVQPAEASPVAISSLTRTKYVAPKYPRSAQRRNQAGWVDVVFTVAVDGTVKDIEVRNAQPGEVFVDAARNAVSKWEFEPVVQNGQPVDTLAGVRLMFALEE